MSVQSFDPPAHEAAASVPFVPSPEIVSELLISKWPREARACLTALTLEIGSVWTRSWSPFLCLYGFVEWTGSLATFPTWSGSTGPTGQPTSAFGPWQDERGTDAEISALVGDPSVEPQDQINKNWVLAVRDYGRQAGGDLLSDLQAGLLDKVQEALVHTWPAGSDVGFADRYTAALQLFPLAAAPPAPAPIPQPPAPSPSTSMLPAIPVGDECRVTISAATDDRGGAVAAIPADLLKPDDATICTATIEAMTLAIAGLAVGKTTLRGADLAIPVTVAPRPVSHLTIDFSSAVLSPIAAAAKAMMARLPMTVMVAALMLATAQPIMDTAYVPMMATAILPTPVPSLASSLSPPAFGSVAFCFESSSQSVVALERCLRWVAALSRR